MRILIVEDEPKVTTVIKRSLEEEQHVVDACATASEGDYLASIQDYDLLILDCLLPDGDGRKLCRSLRSRSITTPVLLLTAKASTEDKVLGLDSGADDYLTKPFDVKELRARVRALGRRGVSVRQQSVVVADLVIDPTMRRMTRNGQVISLTAKEFQLLELLARRAGQVVTRTEIFEKVWDMNYDPNSNVIEVFIKVLRDKIDRGFGQKLIQTVRGVGYMIQIDT